MEKLTELSAQNVPELWERRGQLFRESSVDLSALARVDSAGIAFLVRWSKSLGRPLKLECAPARALELINTFRLAPLFEFAGAAAGAAAGSTAVSGAAAPGAGLSGAAAQNAAVAKSAAGPQ